MNILYFSSWYPMMNDTFVVREILEIVNRGHNVKICVLKANKKKDYANGIKEINAEEVNILKMNFNPIIIFLSFINAFFSVPKGFVKSFSEMLFASIKQPNKFYHYLYIFISVLYFYKQKSILNANYIHTHFLHSGAIAARWFSILSNIPYGFTAHIAKIRYEKELMKKIIKDSNICVGDTQETMRFIKDISGRDGVLIKNSIDVSSVKFDNKNISSEIQIPFILACGTLIPPKGFDVLVKACNILYKESMIFFCKIIGDGPERKNLEEIGKELINNNFLELSGTIPIGELIENYSKADIFVMPSIPSRYGRDGLPTVIIEAMAKGVPVIGTAHAAIPELVINNQTGLLVPPDDPKAIAESIKNLINNPELRKKIILQARKKIEEEHNIKKNIGILLSLINNLNYE